MRVVVLGSGETGARACRQLVSTGDDTDVVLAGPDIAASQVLAAQMGDGAHAMSWEAAIRESADVVVLDVGRGHRALARAALERGSHVVSVATTLEEVEAMVTLDEAARRHHRHVVVGAAFAPGLSCVLARHGVVGLDRVEEIHVAKWDAEARPRTSRRRLGRALPGPEWRDGRWAPRSSRTGARRIWFPPPVGERECGGGPDPDPYLLVPAFPGVGRVTCRSGGSTSKPTRSARSRRKPGRNAMRLGQIGALRIEVRGRIGSAVEMRTLGAVDRPDVAGGAVCALAALWAGEGRLVRPGAGGLAELVGDTAAFLGDLAARGVRAAVPDREPAGG